MTNLVTDTTVVFSRELRPIYGPYEAGLDRFVDLRKNDPRVEGLARLGMPAVIVGGPLRNGALPSVWHDEAAVLGLSRREQPRYPGRGAGRGRGHPAPHNRGAPMPVARDIMTADVTSIPEDATALDADTAAVLLLDLASRLRANGTHANTSRRRPVSRPTTASLP